MLEGFGRPASSSLIAVVRLPQEWGNTATRKTSQRIVTVETGSVNACGHRTYGSHEFVIAGNGRCFDASLRKPRMRRE